PSSLKPIIVPSRPLQFREAFHLELRRDERELRRQQMTVGRGETAIHVDDVMVELALGLVDVRQEIDSFLAVDDATVWNEASFRNLHADDDRTDPDEAVR